MPFVDRAIPATVAERLAAPLGRALAAEDPSRGLGILLARFGQLAALAGAGPRLARRGGLDERDFNL